VFVFYSAQVPSIFSERVYAVKGGYPNRHYYSEAASLFVAEYGGTGGEGDFATPILKVDFWLGAWYNSFVRTPPFRWVLDYIYILDNT